jgi:hypothetical protein
MQRWADLYAVQVVQCPFTFIDRGVPPKVKSARARDKFGHSAELEGLRGWTCATHSLRSVQEGRRFALIWNSPRSRAGLTCDAPMALRKQTWLSALAFLRWRLTIRA